MSELTKLVQDLNDLDNKINRLASLDELGEFKHLAVCTNYANPSMNERVAVSLAELSETNRAFVLQLIRKTLIDQRNALVYKLNKMSADLIKEIKQCKKKSGTKGS